MMIRNLKVLGLALLSVLAMSAVAASAASAANFMSEVASTTLKGTQKTTNVITLESGQTECTEANFTGTATGTEFSEATVTPTYSGCTTFGIESDLNMNGCKYKLTSATPGLRTGRIQHRRVQCRQAHRILDSGGRIDILHDHILPRHIRPRHIQERRLRQHRRHCRLGDNQRDRILSRRRRRPLRRRIGEKA